MKRTLTSLLIMFGLLTPIAVPAYAAAYNIVPECGSSLNSKNTSFCSDVTNAKPGTSSNPVLKIIKVVIVIISFVTGVAAVILIVISAIKFVTSGGDSAKVASARGSLLNAVIGIIITVLAQTIVVFVLDKIK